MCGLDVFFKICIITLLWGQGWIVKRAQSGLVTTLTDASVEAIENIPLLKPRSKLR